MGQIVKQKYTPIFCEKIYPIIFDHAGDGESDHAGYEESEHAGYDPGAQVFQNIPHYLAEHAGYDPGAQFFFLLTPLSGRACWL